MRYFACICGFIFAVLACSVSYAQEDEKSSFTRYVEEKLSSPNRKIRLNGLKGTLSSYVSLESITISDAEGVWLKINRPKLTWNRSALLLGKIDIDTLEAESIDYLRSALPDESLPAAESSSFSVPELPVSVILKKLTVPRVSFGKDVFGLAADTAVAGKIILDAGSLDLNLSIERLDGPGGVLSVKAKYSNSDQKLFLDANLAEPANGIFVNLLNIEGKPPVQLSLDGNAPLSDLTVNMRFDVDQRRILSGDLRVQNANEGTQLQLDAGGPIASILPQNVRAFFGLESTVKMDARIDAAGGLDVKSVQVNSGAVAFNMQARRLADGFLSALKIQAQLTSSDGTPIVLPTGDAGTTVSQAVVNLDYDAEKNDAWDGVLTVQDLKGTDVSIQSINLKTNGTVKGLNGNKRALTFELDGLLDGFLAKDTAVNEAVGRSLKFGGNGNWETSQALTFRQMTLTGETFSSVLKGSFIKGVFDGSFELDANRLAAFSALLDRDLKGRADLRADGTVELFTGGFSLRLNGTTRQLDVGIESARGLLEDTTMLSGQVTRNAAGVTFNSLLLANRNLKAQLDGNFSSTSADIQALLSLADLSHVSPQGSGVISANIGVKGNQRPLTLSANVSMPSGILNNRPIQDLALAFNGLTDFEFVRGKISSRGTLNGKPVNVRGEITADAKNQNLQAFVADVGDARIDGSVDRNASGLIDANLKIAADDIRDLAALTLLDVSGAINGTVDLSQESGQQSGTFNIKGRDLQYQNYSIGVADIDAELKDMFGQVSISAKLDGQKLKGAGVEIRTLSGQVQTEGKTTVFDINAALAQNDTRISAKGKAQQADLNTSVLLDTLSINSNITDARLLKPSTIEIDDGNVQISNTQLSVGSGRVSVSGTVGDRLSLDVALNALPLAIANAIRPETKAAGTLSGTVQVSGSSANPIASFDLNGRGLSFSQLAQNGVLPLDLKVNGSYANNSVNLASSNASNAQDIQITASGRVPVRGTGLSLNAQGRVPLTLAQSALASRGATVSGQGRFDVNMSGSLSDPKIVGLASVSGATLTDPLSNLKLTDIGLIAGLNGNTFSISRASARLSSGGTVSATGTVGISDNLPANISVQLNQARYTDGQTVNTLIDGKLSLTGNLAVDPLMSGTLDLGRTEISIPESFANGSDLLEVKHVRPSRKTTRTLARLKRSTPVTRPTARPAILKLDIKINAPNQIFVRGRGVDAELGGSVRIRGPVSNVSPTGRFSLRRGRLSILGQRIDLKEGAITLVGDLDPIINVRAETQAGDIEAYIDLKGPVSNPDVVFSSSPELPQDEVLAIILFGRGIGDLSPAQIIRLAAVASQLTGGKNPGLVDGIRKNVGLDDLDIVQDQDGNTAVKAGKYINDNVYVGVQVGKKTETTINLDITDNITARGAISSEGDTSIGIFLEKDY